MFEAFIASKDNAQDNLGVYDAFENEEEKNKRKKMKRQSKQVLQELKGVLVGKQQEWKVREKCSKKETNGVRS